MFQLFANVSLLTFSEVIETSDANGQIRLAIYEPGLSPGGAVGTPVTTPDGYTSSIMSVSSFAGIPWGDAYNTGDIFFSGVEFLDPSLSNGNYVSDTILHEIGHALGLSHPHDAIGNYDSDTANTSKVDTIMAYTHYDGDSVGSTDGSYSKPTTLMVTDIAAIQFMYGVNEQYNSGNTTYTIGSFSSENYIYASIWDAGGIDTFSWADQSTISYINLAPGSYSFFGKISSQSDPDLKSAFGAGDGILGIAENTIIENAIGGSANDFIFGNSVGNTLYGGAGEGVGDLLHGNGGADIFVCSLADASTDLLLTDVILDFTNGTDFIGLEDRSFSDLVFSNVVMAGSGGTQIMDISSDKKLFWLYNIEADELDETDFIVTDFV